MIHRSERIEFIQNEEDNLKKTYGDCGKYIILLTNITGKEIDEGPFGKEKERAISIINDIWENINTISNVTYKNLSDNHYNLNETQLNIYQSFNQTLSALGFENFNIVFFNKIFLNTIREGKKYSNISINDILTWIEDSLTKFRIFSIYYFGNFRQPYIKYRNMENGECYNDFVKKWELLQKENEFQKNPNLTGFQLIDEDIKWCIGYLMGEYSEKVQKSRNGLKEIIDEAIRKNANSYEEICKKSSKRKIEIDQSLFNSYLPPKANLLDYFNILCPFHERLLEAQRICSISIKDRIEIMRQKARENMFYYLTLPSIDIYFATSMRDPEHFYNTTYLIDEIFSKNDLEEYNLIVFDPTSSFSHDRLDKGLMECLMIKCSKITLYNAQESDTFGKDVEAALSLAAKHPVIVYVIRLFEKELKDVYNLIDNSYNINIKEFTDKIYEIKGFDFKIFQERIKTPGTKVKVLEEFLKLKIPNILRTISNDRLYGEYIINGYPCIDESGHLSGDIIEKIAKSIISLEKRAMIFKEGHPLSMITSPIDGVARGIIVTRTIKKTQEIVKAILDNSINFKLIRNDYCWKLEDDVTNTPIRIITADKTLTNSFWDKYN